MALLTRPKKTKSGQPHVILRVFRGFLIGAMRARWVTIGATLACFVAALLASPYVPRQFFPSSDRPELLVDLRLPQNASIYASETLAARLDDLLKGDPDVERWSTYGGRGAIRFYLPLNVELQNDFFSQAVVVAKDVAARERLHTRLERALAEKFPSCGLPGFAVGHRLPPVGWPVQYRVSGPNLNEARDIAMQLAEVMAENSTVRNRSISIGWSRRGWFASASIKIRRGYWGLVPRPSPRC